MVELTKLLNRILSSKEAPNEWRKSITIPILKKGGRKSPENYRGITLLNTTMKLFTKIIETTLNEHVNTSEEQQGFRKNRSTIEAIFTISQVVENTIEYDKLAYM
ncbi:uncharacterized protein LOC130441681 [Diorhabda sublineata]|uniref:uncharacterized protein LOC130441681 n=1 Tax=Diorhabda sublineata TaxID=1163346 RepID=UPI0024E060D7|nr:uncharacterized protein LOC130441681 [Diorhabda sublineata]